MPMVWSKFELPLGGLDTYTDAHHIAPGKLAELENARFDNPPGINKRYGYAAFTTDTYNAGTPALPTPIVGSLTEASRVFEHNGELLLVSQASLLGFTLTGADQKWVPRGVVPTTWLERRGVIADPINSVLQADVAYNQGVTVYAHNSSFTITIYDSLGGVLERVTDASFAGGRLISVGNFIYLFTNDAGSFRWTRIDVTSENYTFPALTTIASIDIETTAGRGIWDVCAVGSANWAVAYEDNSTNTVHVALFDAATNTEQDNEDTGESGLDVISVRGTMSEQVWAFYGTATPTIRATAYAVTTTTLTQTLAPTSVNTGIAAPDPRNIASARLSATMEGFIWTHIRDAAAPVDTMEEVCWNTITTAGTLGTIAILEDCTLISKPWEAHVFSIYAAVAFNDLANEQGTGYIIRWGQNFTGSIEPNAGWYGTFCRGQTDIWPTFHLPNVVTAGIAPWDVQIPVRKRYKFLFAADDDVTTIETENVALDRLFVDYNEPGRFMSAEWGPGRFIAGGRPGWYDGASVVEHGFAWYPTLREGDATPGAGGGLDPGDYQICWCYEALDRNGMLHRSAPSAPATITVVTAGAIDVEVLHGLELTDRRGTVSSATVPQIVPFRTLMDGTVFYRALPYTGFTTGNTARTVNATDVNDDEGVGAREVLYTTGDILDNAGTPPCRYAHRHQDRMWLAGMENPNTLWFSQPFVETEAPRFSEALILDVGERVTAIGSMDEKLVAFSETQVYQIIGNGPPASGGVDIGFAVDLVTGDTGCIEQRSVVETPRGVMFRGRKGFYLLTRGGELAYVGAAVQGIARAYANCTSAVLLSLRNEVRFTIDDGENSRILHYNYFLDQWSVDVMEDIVVSACLWLNVYVWATAGGQVYVESIGAYADPGNAFIPLKVTTPWIAMDTKQGWQRIRGLSLLGRSAGSHGLRIRIAYDYSSAWAQTITVTGSQLALLPLEQIRIRFARQKCQAFRVEIIDTMEDDPTAGLNLTSLVFEIGLKKGTAKLQAAATR